MQYIGIASDEQERLVRLEGQKISLLDKYGVDEAGAYELCKRTGLLSPIYEFADRNGCFFCPNAKLPELRHLRRYHPDLWGRLLQIQALPNKPTERFNRTMTLYDIEQILRAESRQERTELVRDTRRNIDRQSAVLSGAVIFCSSVVTEGFRRILSESLCISSPNKESSK